MLYKDNNSNIQQQGTPEEWTTIQQILESVETDKHFMKNKGKGPKKAPHMYGY